MATQTTRTLGLGRPAGEDFFIGGGWIAAQSSERRPVISPVTEEPIADIAVAAKADIDAAVSAARTAFAEGPWPRMTPQERVQAIRRLQAVMERRQEDLSQLLTEEMGGPITQSRNIQAAVPIRMLAAHMEIAEAYPWQAVRRAVSGNALVLRQPKGVVALIVPWNAPMMATITKLGPALLTGNTVVLKPALETALSANLLGEMIAEAQLPRGVVNIVAADREESEYLALHPDVDKVSFTGSTLAGRTLARKCGDLLRPITLELGGKSAGIILDDADLPSTVEALRMGSFRNSGQICSLKTRILVPRRRESEVIDALAALIDTMPVGDPLDPATQIGPMVSERQRDRVSDYIDIGSSEGARLIRGGAGRPAGVNRGWFVRPTLFADVDPASRIAQEEIFGPVLTVTGYDTEEEAIAIANHSDYGLSGAVFSQDISRAVSVASRIKTGVVEVNGSGAGLLAPFGGVKQSGLGRESGPEGFEPYVEIKSVGIPAAYADDLALEIG